MAPKRRPPRRAIELDPKKHAENVRYGRRYRTERKKVLSKSPWCALQLPGCTVWATQTDHVDPKGPSTTANLVPCCASCNQKKRGLLQRRRGGARARSSGDGPSSSEVPTRAEFGTSCPHRLPDGSLCIGREGHWSRMW